MEVMTRAMRLDRLRMRLRDWATDPTQVEMDRVLNLILYVGGLADADRDDPGYGRPYYKAAVCLEEIANNWDLLGELLELACDPPEEGE
mgnify:CR=1 FL=1